MWWYRVFVIFNSVQCMHTMVIIIISVMHSILLTPTMVIRKHLPIVSISFILENGEVFLIHRRADSVTSLVRFGMFLIPVYT